MQHKDPIRIAAIVDGPSVPSASARRALDAICSDARFLLTKVIVYPAAKSDDAALFRIVNTVDERVFARPRECETPAFDAVCEKITVIETDTIGAGDVDVVLDFSSAGALDALRNDSRYGLWRLTAFDAHAAMPEVLPSTVAGVDLYRFADLKTPPRLIANAQYNVKPTAARTVAFVREKSVQLLMRELKRLALSGAPADLGLYEPRRRVARSNADAVAYGARLAGGLLWRGIERLEDIAGLRPGMFYLKYGQGNALDFDPIKAVDILPKGNCYWADPFLFEDNRERFIFFEEYAYGTRKGHIAVGKFVDGKFREIGPALVTDYHLSYPFVFRHDGDIFMLPETNQTKRLEIWRAKKFPDQWELHQTSLEGVATADSALFQHNGEWWLFTNISKDSYGDHCTELHLFRTDGPMLQSLEPHPLNPVVIDATTARGGGRIIEQDGRLLRLSQDNSHGTYGFGLNVMEITRLDFQIFSERLVRKITPNFESGLIGCHHVDFVGGVYVMDVRKKRGGFSGRK